MTSLKLVPSAVLTTVFATTLALLAPACSSGGPSEPGDPDPMPDPMMPQPAASFALELSTDKLPVLTGTSATIEVTLTRTGSFDGAVTLRVLVAGQANGGPNSDFAVTRYWR